MKIKLFAFFIIFARICGTLGGLCWSRKLNSPVHEPPIQRTNSSARPIAFYELGMQSLNSRSGSRTTNMDKTRREGMSRVNNSRRPTPRVISTRPSTFGMGTATTNAGEAFHYQQFTNQQQKSPMARYGTDRYRHAYQQQTTTMARQQSRIMPYQLPPQQLHSMSKKRWETPPQRLPSPAEMLHQQKRNNTKREQFRHEAKPLAAQQRQLKMKGPALNTATTTTAGKVMPQYYGKNQVHPQKRHPHSQQQQLRGGGGGRPAARANGGGGFSRSGSGQIRQRMEKQRMAQERRQNEDRVDSLWEKLENQRLMGMRPLGEELAEEQMDALWQQMNDADNNGIGTTGGTGNNNVASSSINEHRKPINSSSAMPKRRINPLF